jgi:nickel-dependent lactate racemase
MVNREYLACDMKIGIGSFIPHSFCGFGGGYKIVMPAISHIDAIEHHHGILLKRFWEEAYVVGKYRDNPLLKDLKEYGRIVGLDITINVLINEKAENVDIYAGDPDGLYEYMEERAPLHYGTSSQKKADIVFVNAYAKANEAVIALSLAEAFLKDGGGSIVVLCDIEGGQVVHYLLGRFGKDVWGKLAFGERKKDSRVKRIYIYSRHRDKANDWWFGSQEDIFWSGDLKEIIRILQEEYKGKHTDVHVIPDGTIQMLS